MWTRLLLVMLIDYIIVTILSLAILGLLQWYDSIPFHHFSAVPCPRRRWSAVDQQLDNALLEVDNKGWPHDGAARTRERETGKGKRIRVRRIVCVVNYCISSSFARESSRIPWQRGATGDLRWMKVYSRVQWMKGRNGTRLDQRSLLPREQRMSFVTQK